MNLPATAIEFLDAFRGLYRPLYELQGAREAVEKSKLPMVHCYCFTKDVEHAEEDICAVSASLSPRLGGTDVVFLAESNQGAGDAGDEPDGGLQASLRQGRRTEEGDVLLGVPAVEGDGCLRGRGMYRARLFSLLCFRSSSLRVGAKLSWCEIHVRRRLSVRC